jgi:hypothetical protein
VTNSLKIFSKLIVDSPGVSVPSVIPNELGIRLELMGVIKEEVADQTLEFLSYWFMEQTIEKYWQNLRVCSGWTSWCP